MKLGKHNVNIDACLNLIILYLILEVLVMEKSSMTLGETTRSRISNEYTAGVFAFVEYAKGFENWEGKIRCPCKKCLNTYKLYGDTMACHLLANGFIQDYIVWHYHRENRASTVRVKVQDNEFVVIDALVEDHIRAKNIDHDGTGESADTAYNKSVQKFDKLL